MYLYDPKMKRGWRAMIIYWYHVTLGVAGFIMLMQVSLSQHTKTTTLYLRDIELMSNEHRYSKWIFVVSSIALH